MKRQRHRYHPVIEDLRRFMRSFAAIERRDRRPYWQAIEAILQDDADAFIPGLHSRRRHARTVRPSPPEILPGPLRS